MDFNMPTQAEIENALADADAKAKLSVSKDAS
jgi:hypothetical protein